MIHKAWRATQFCLIFGLVSLFLGIARAVPQSEFPIGYSSLGGTYAFIS
ncbi:MAG TPA: hypothetical protein VE689_09435 [Candidatus Udaeobacter sp.]|nr:hypothetical protein [Candidatus Udaeobacter sp.]